MLTPYPDLNEVLRQFADEVLALQEMHARIYDGPCEWARHLEGSYFPPDILRGASRTSEELWYFDNGARQMIRSTHCNTAIFRQTVRQHGVPLVGPDPSTLIDPIPIEQLRGDMLRTLVGWGREILAKPEPWANRFYQGFIVLTYCRLWCDLTTGTVGSKRRAAEWTKVRIDPGWHDLIDRAWETRPDPATSVRTPADPDDYARTLEFLRLILDRCAEVA